MKKVFVVVLVFLAIIIGTITFISISTKTVVDIDESNNDIYVTNKIKKVIITDGRNGYKAIIENEQELVRIEDMIINIPFIEKTEKDEEMVGYLYLVFLETSEGGISFMDYKRVTFGYKDMRFRNPGDYNELMEIIVELYRINTDDPAIK